MIRIVVANQRGGAGKTTTASTLGRCLASGTLSMSDTATGLVSSEAAAAAITPMPPPLAEEASLGSINVGPPAHDLPNQASADVRFQSENSESSVTSASERSALIKAAGTQARMDAIATGLSPQQAINAEREAKASLRSMPLNQVKDLIGQMDNALRRMPPTGGRVDGTTPSVGHGDQ